MTAEFNIAIHGLIYLDHTGRITSSEELANNICTNPARVRKVMTRLKRAGLVESSEGKGSGYHKIETSAEINLMQIQKALGEIAVAETWRSGDINMECMIASGMADVMDHIYENMNELCSAYLETITVREIIEKLFGGKKDGSFTCNKGKL